MGRTYKISEVNANPVLRMPTGFQELDWLYGYSVFSNDISFWGLPQGKISLWSGESGIGKSRMAIKLAANFVEAGVKTLYFQNEVDVSTFAGWVKNGSNLSISHLQNFICCDSITLPEIITAIYKEKPQIVIVDSVNEIEEFESGSKKQARLIINGLKGSRGFRQACLDIKCHIILLAQLNQDGTIKGGTSLPHLVDIALNLTSCDKQRNGLFVIGVGIKHRYGRTGPEFRSIWQHIDSGVECISDYSLEDERWCKTHNIPVRNMKEYVASLSGKNENVAPNNNWKRFFKGWNR